MKKLLILFLLSICCISYAADTKSSEKIYIDEQEFSSETETDSFHIHIGNNVWLVTNTVHRDMTGLFSYECDLTYSMINAKMEYEKRWKCPYCYIYWPIGSACRNPNCPSKYK